MKKILSLNKIGVYGTISQLADIDQKYSKSIEVAAGSRYNNIIVEDDKTATDCIKVLKESRIGIATFLPLNKIKPFKIDSSGFKQSGIHGSALSLISKFRFFTKSANFSIFIISFINCWS